MSATHDFAYEHDGLRLKGQIARPSGRGLHPAVLVMHSALGIDRLVCRRAGDLAALGYVALATDMYGAGRQLTKEEAGKHFLGLVENPDLLRATRRDIHRGPRPGRGRKRTRRRDRVLLRRSMCAGIGAQRR